MRKRRTVRLPGIVGVLDAVNAVCDGDGTSCGDVPSDGVVSACRGVGDGLWGDGWRESIDGMNCGCGCGCGFGCVCGCKDDVGDGDDDDDTEELRARCGLWYEILSMTEEGRMCRIPYDARVDGYERV